MCVKMTPWNLKILRSLRVIFVNLTENKHICDRPEAHEAVWGILVPACALIQGVPKQLTFFGGSYLPNADS